MYKLLLILLISSFAIAANTPTVPDQPEIISQINDLIPGRNIMVYTTRIRWINAYEALYTTIVWNSDLEPMPEALAYRTSMVGHYSAAFDAQAAAVNWAIANYLTPPSPQNNTQHYPPAHDNTESISNSLRDGSGY